MSSGDTKPTRRKVAGQKVLPAAFVAHQFQPGQSGNPNGNRGSLYAETVRICREATPEAAQRMVELMRSKDERISLVATDKVIERAWGKPRETVPQDRPRPDLSVLTEKERQQLVKLVEKAAKAGAFAGLAEKGKEGLER